MLLATTNKPVLLSAATSDGNTSLYVRARIIDNTGSLVTSVSLPHQTLGVYGANYTPTVEGVYSVLYQFYTDAGFTVAAGYDTVAEAMDVSSFKTDIKRTLGLLHDNALVDMQSYDANDNLTSARIRVYDSAANMAAASAISPASSPTGQLYEYSVSAVYAGDLLTKYSIIRVT